MNALTLRDVISKTGIPRSTIYKKIADGHFPAPAHAGRRSIWSSLEIEAWLAERFAERDRQLAQGGA